MANELYLIRHGVAAQRGDAWPDDTRRPLTERGISRLKKISQALAKLDMSFDLILTSPLVRARQTAEIVAGVLQPHPPIVTAESLMPNGAYAAVVDELGHHARRSRIALVGHEPGIGQLAARLIGSRRPLEFKKGAICRIDVDALPPTGPGALQWFLPPKMLRKLAK